MVVFESKWSKYPQYFFKIFGKTFLKINAPKEVRDSYNTYLEQIRKYEEIEALCLVVYKSDIETHKAEISEWEEYDIYDDMGNHDSRIKTRVFENAAVKAVRLPYREHRYLDKQSYMEDLPYIHDEFPGDRDMNNNITPQKIIRYKKFLTKSRFHAPTFYKTCMYVVRNNYTLHFFRIHIV